MHEPFQTSIKLKLFYGIDDYNAIIIIARVHEV